VAVDSATEILQAINLQAANTEPTDVKKSKATKQKVKQHKKFEVVGKRLKAAKRQVNSQLEIEAKRQCRQLCEEVYQTLP